MDLSIAALLAQDGITNGAIYALLALALVLVFAVTRVIFIPPGEFVAYGTLTLAGAAARQAAGHRRAAGRPGGRRRRDGALRGGARREPGADCRAGWRLWTGRAAGDRRARVVGWRRWRLPFRVQILLTLALVTALGPLLYRIAYQPLAEASVLVLLIVSVAVHFALTRPRPVVLRRRGLAHAGVHRPRRSASAPSTISGQSLLVVLHSALVADRRALRCSSTARCTARRCARPRSIASARAWSASRPNLAGALTFTLAALLCAFSGVLIGPITTIYYDSGFLISLKGFVGAIIGGLVELSARGGRRAAGRAARVVLVVLGERVQGSDRLHADHSGAAVAQPRPRIITRKRSDAMRRARRSCVFVAALLAAPLAAPPFWVTLLNYIGLYSIVALGLVLLTGVAGQTSFGQAAFVGLGAYTTAYPDDALRRCRRGSTLVVGLALTLRRRAVRSASSRCA